MDNSDWYNHIDLLRTKIKKNISKKELSETLKKNINTSNILSRKEFCYKLI